MSSGHFVQKACAEYSDDINRVLACMPLTRNVLKIIISSMQVSSILLCLSSFLIR